MSFDSPNLELFPDYANVTAYEVILEPGEILYVPPCWFHHVEATTASSIYGAFYPFFFTSFLKSKFFFLVQFPWHRGLRVGLQRA